MDAFCLIIVIVVIVVIVIIIMIMIIIMMMFTAYIALFTSRYDQKRITVVK